MIFKAQAVSRFSKALAAFALACATLGANPSFCAPVVADAAFEQRLRTLETELRCLVCQNQTIADSNAGLAEDLRREVREQALAGRSDDEIKQYLRDRYGDFVLYNPPVEPATWLLWFGPFVLLLTATMIAVWLVRRRPKAAALAAADRLEAERIERILCAPDATPAGAADQPI